MGAASWVGAKTNDIAGVMRVGLSYRVFDYVALNVEYQYTDPISNDVICEFAHQRFSLGITYHFSRARSPAITIEKPVVREVIIEKVVEKIIEVEKVPQREVIAITNINIQEVLFKNGSSMLINTKALLSIVALLEVEAHPDMTVRITGYTDRGLLQII